MSIGPQLRALWEDLRFLWFGGPSSRDAEVRAEKAVQDAKKRAAYVRGWGRLDAYGRNPRRDYDEPKGVEAQAWRDDDPAVRARYWRNYNPRRG